ncbi:MAG TPA: glycosyltransferase family 39 protein, partial [Candidatus Melainabacteria bacterium]|nr:glycosyltransferase family 39 protein [Candidatus Melainabacteria bacterium]
MTARLAIILLFTTALGVVLRLLLIGTGINIDDAITLYVARAENLQQLFERVADREFGPPLYFIIMHYFLAAFGDSTTALAAPSLLFGSLLIPATYLLAKEVCADDKNTAAAAAYFT